MRISFQEYPTIHFEKRKFTDRIFKLIDNSKGQYSRRLIFELFRRPYAIVFIRYPKLKIILVKYGKSKKMAKH